MGVALEVITGQVTNPGATITALTANSGDSFTVRSTDMQAEIDLVQAWSFTNTNLLTRIRSPRMHDQAQNIRLQPTAAQPYPLLPWNATERLWSQDPITVEMTGGAAEVDMTSMLVYYTNLPGIAARLHSIAEIDPLIEHLTTVEVDVTSSATSCNYSTAVALNGTFDTLIRNRDYALLGYNCSTTGGTFGIKGADTGNLRIGGPITNLAFLTDGWFVRLNEAYGYPTIPVFNSGNVASILCDVACQATATVFKLGLNLALLKSTLPAGLP
jgi:hypothetical protein